MRRLGRLPEQAAILQALGDHAARHGHPAQARRRYRQALAILPSTHPAVRHLNSQLSDWPNDGSPVTSELAGVH